MPAKEENIIIQKDKKRLIKICDSPKAFRKEMYIYQQNFSFTVPILDNDGKNTIVLKYIEGIPICDLAIPDFERIAGIYAELHDHDSKVDKCICHNNNHPKNFLYYDRNYFLVDFSTWKYDQPETDLIHFLLYWAAIFPMRRFKKIYQDFIRTYKRKKMINPLEWELLLPEVLDKFDSHKHSADFLNLVNPDYQNRNRELLQLLV